MPSLIWGLAPSAARDRVYEYDVQEQFTREAGALLERLFPILNSDLNRFAAEDRSVEKAVWLLQMEALDLLRESLRALRSKRHRVASAVFRTADEVLDLAAFFSSEVPDSARRLQGWYDDEIVPNRLYRRWMLKEAGEEAATALSERYAALSRMTHRSYRSILHGYTLGREDSLVHDGTAENYGKSRDADTLLVPQQTIAIYLAVLADLILRLCAEIVRYGRASGEEVQMALEETMEPTTVEWRFTTPSEVYERYLQAKESSRSGVPRDRSAEGDAT